eukprot:175744_1
MATRSGGNSILDTICSMVFMLLIEYIWSCLPDWIKAFIINCILILLMYFGGLAYLENMPQYLSDLMNLFPGQEISDIIVHSLIVIIVPIAFCIAFKYVMDTIYASLQWIIRKYNNILAHYINKQKQR